jgi:hypothetical protein
LWGRTRTIDRAGVVKGGQSICKPGAYMGVSRGQEAL